jgi:hypothetical protein
MTTNILNLRCEGVSAAKTSLAQRLICGYSCTQGYARFARSPWAIIVLPLQGNDVFVKIGFKLERWSRGTGAFYSSIQNFIQN